MAFYDEMDTSQLLNLKKGEKVQIRYQRHSDFRVYSVDGITVLGQLPAHVVLSVFRFEPVEVLNIGQVQDITDLGPIITVSNVTAKTATVEDAQLRISPMVAIDLAVSLLVNLLPTLGDAIKGKIADSQALKGLFAENE